MFDILFRNAKVIDGTGNPWFYGDVGVEGGTVAAPADSATVPTTFTATYNNTETPQKQNDCYLCTDVLAMEKHASHLYDTCVFEFNDANARSVLNDIQKQEQHHGKVIYDYMNTNAMYA